MTPTLLQMAECERQIPLTLLRLLSQPSVALPLGVFLIDGDRDVGRAAARAAGPTRAPPLHDKAKASTIKQNLQRAFLIPANLVQCEKNDELICAR